MSLVKFVIIFSLVIVALGIIWSRDSNSSEDYVKSYSVVASNARPQDAVFSERVMSFEGLYRQLGTQQIVSTIKDIYAENLYFNDTLKTITDRETLSQYLLETGARIESSHFNIEDSVARDNELYIRWKMQFSFKLLGKTVQSESIGMTHLRYNDAGRIVLHQDFWDGAHGFYQHIPIIGSMMGWIRNRL